MAVSATAGKKDIQFLWEGKDKRGNKVRGKSLAANETALRADLRRQGVAATRIKTPSSMFRSGGKVSAMQKLVLDIKANIEGGSTLHESLAKHPLYFDDLFVNLVEAGEQAGALEGLLDKVATYKEKSEAVKKKVKKALFYPAAVLVVAVIVTVILLVFVIPQFEDLFKGFGADLPAFTQMVINLSKFVQSQGIFIAIILGAAGWVFFYFKKRSRKMRHFLDRAILKMPIIGPIL